MPFLFQFLLLFSFCIYLSMDILQIWHLCVTVEVEFYGSNIWGSDLPHPFFCSLGYYAGGEIWGLWLHIYCTQVPPPFFFPLLHKHTKIWRWINPLHSCTSIGGILVVPMLYWWFKDTFRLICLNDLFCV